MNLFNSKQVKRDESIPTVSTVLEKATDNYIVPVDECNSLILKCPECKGIHFRHAGYIETVLPHIEAGGAVRIINQSHQVKVCVKCRHSYVSIGEEHMYDITNDIDLKAWEKAEKELNNSTGPGGEC